jgi:hypothetical protein
MERKDITLMVLKQIVRTYLEDLDRVGRMVDLKKERMREYEVDSSGSGYGFVSTE